VSALRFSKDGRRLAVGTSHGLIYMLDTGCQPQWTQTWTRGPNVFEIWKIVFAGSSEDLRLCGHDGLIRQCWGAAVVEQRQLRDVANHEQLLTAVSEQRIVVKQPGEGSEESDTLIELTPPDWRPRVLGRSSPSDMIITPKGLLLIGTALPEMWTRSLHRWFPLSGSFTAVNATGELVAFASNDRIRVGDLETGSILEIEDEPEPFEGWFSRDNEWLITHSTDGLKYHCIGWECLKRSIESGTVACLTARQRRQFLGEDEMTAALRSSTCLGKIKSGN